ncbi:MAG: stage III sporulation protein AE [Peptococcaceae bacterium]
MTPRKINGKISVFIFMLFFFFSFFSSDATNAAQTEDSAAQKEAQKELAAQIQEINHYLQQLDREVQQSVPEFSFKELVMRLIKKDVDWKPEAVFYYLLNYLFREVVANASLLGKLVILAVICAVLQNLMAAFEKSTTGQLAYLVIYLVLITAAVTSFGLALNLGREAVDKMAGFMQALLPVLLTLLTATGAVTTTALFHPVIFVSLTAIGTLIKNIVLPLVFFAVILNLISHLAPDFKLSNLAGLIKTGALGIAGLFSTVFLGILAVYGVGGAVGDSIAMRTAKFAVDAFVPIVGGMFTDAMEIIAGSSLLIKNAVGIAGMVGIFFIMGLPLLKIIALAFIYKLAGALLQPVGEGRMVECLNDLGNSLLVVFAVVATTGLLFFFALTIVIGVGNLVIMLR